MVIHVITNFELVYIRKSMNNIFLLINNTFQQQFLVTQVDVVVQRVPRRSSKTFLAVAQSQKEQYLCTRWSLRAKTRYCAVLHPLNILYTVCQVYQQHSRWLLLPLKIWTPLVGNTTCKRFLFIAVLFERNSSYSYLNTKQGMKTCKILLVLNITGYGKIKKCLTDSKFQFILPPKRHIVE